MCYQYLPVLGICVHSTLLPGGIWVQGVLVHPTIFVCSSWGYISERTGSG